MAATFASQVNYEWFCCTKCLALQVQHHHQLGSFEMGCWQQKHILKDLATAAIAAEAQLQTVSALVPSWGGGSQAVESLLLLNGKVLMRCL